MELNLRADELNTCVQCGLCLPHCPTFRVTGDESQSPRGRIALIRAVQCGAPPTPEVMHSFDTCVQCRGCEAACPSQVPFGHLMEDARATLVEAGASPSFARRAMLAPVSRPRLLRSGTAALGIAQRARLIPRRASASLGLPGRLPVRNPSLKRSGDDVVLFTGCVMDAWQRDIHRATKGVLETAHAGVRPTGDVAPCCGALHLHAGLRRRAVTLARGLVSGLDGEQPVLVNSAGCGATMKDYGRLLDDAAGARFASRVLDVHEWLAARIDLLPAVEKLDLRVAVQDPCHLRHVQRAHEATRVVLRHFVREVVELDDQGLCCGAGGAYSWFERDSARAIRSRKVAAIDRAGVGAVASANPGCAMHLDGGGVTAVHPMTLAWAAITGAEGDVQLQGPTLAGQRSVAKATRPWRRALDVARPIP